MFYTLPVERLNHMGQLLLQVENVGHALYGIRSVLSGQPFILQQKKVHGLNTLNKEGLEPESAE